MFGIDRPDDLFFQGARWRHARDEALDRGVFAEVI
jgi:hypothetical protein